MNMFIRQPAEFFSEELSKREKCSVLGIALLYDMVFTSFIFLLIYLFDEYVLTLRTKLDDAPLWGMVLLVVFIVPFFEELLFRLPLRYNRNWLWRTLERAFNLQSKAFWNRNYRFIFYAFVGLFGVMHLTNYNNNETLFYVFTPVIVGPQLFGGLLLSYVRLRLGFWWGFAKHSIWNAVVILVSIFFFHNKEVIHIDESNLNLSIYELTYVNKEDQNIKIFRNEAGLIDSISMKSGCLQQLMDSLYQRGRFAVLNDTWMNLKLNTIFQTVNKTELLNILKGQYRIRVLQNQ